MEYLIIALFVLIFVGPFAIYGGYHLWKAITRELIIQERAKYWHDADQNGNYPLFYDRSTDRALRTRPGNPPYPTSAPVYQNNPPTKKQAERPLVITTLKPPQLDTGERSIEPNVLEEPNVQALLAEAKANRRPKADSIRLITGVTKGASKAWNDWSEIWDNL